MANFLDKNGLQYFWSKIKTALNGKSDVNHSHSYNDLSDQPDIPDKMHYYGTCSTSASTSEKIVTTTNGGLILRTGTVVDVFFNYGNSSSIPKLNVDDSGTINIVNAGGTINSHLWRNGEVVRFVYNGSRWYLTSKSKADTTYWGITKLSDSVNSTSTTMAATANAVKEAYDLANNQKSSITALQTRVTVLENELEEIDARITALENK